ncbi:P-loop containing nucleoside triphosphate hydrolase protein [Myxozyma melibiosi]|uniref:P-loop containing nucleoside triphosphate hydrolase protein n=1 Tax=Myxozyma melibiosi TaxID=54550 RepID=A0ABR1F0P1_9ASCO
MTDVFSLLPDIQLEDYDLLNLFSECNYLAADLAALSSSVDTLARRTRRSEGEVRAFMDAYERELKKGDIDNGPVGISECAAVNMKGGDTAQKDCLLRFFTTGDDLLDSALFGGVGIATGCITEFVGESSVGKSTVLTQLCVSVQLPLVYGGLDREAVYISTEGGLSTHRLNMLLASFRTRYPDARKTISADRIHYVACRDLEEQDHIIQYQLPTFVRNRNIGLIVLDSIASHYRAEQVGSGPSAMYTRGNELLKTASMLRRLAKECRCAVVVANQVTDLFRVNQLMQDAINSASVMTSTPPPQASQSTQACTQKSQSPPISADPNSSTASIPPAAITSDPPLSFDELEAELFASRMEDDDHAVDFDIMELDLQSRFYTGWNWLSDAPSTKSILVREGQGKTTAMGHVWSICVAQRVVLKRETSGIEYDLGRGRRSMEVVFSPYFESGNVVEFEIDNEGVKGVAGSDLSRAQ